MTAVFGTIKLTKEIKIPINMKRDSYATGSGNGTKAHHPTNT